MAELSIEHTDPDGVKSQGQLENQSQIARICASFAEQTQSHTNGQDTPSDASSIRTCYNFDNEPSKSSISISTDTRNSDVSSTSTFSSRRSGKKGLLTTDALNSLMSTLRLENTHSFENLQQLPRQRRPWLATWMRLGPLSGIFCMFLAAAGIVASFGILAGSDEQPVTAWPSPPATYLAIFTAIANLSMRYAAIQGIIVAWWLRAINGTTLAKLHWDWRAGTTLRGAVMSGRHMGLLGLACIFSTVVVVNGPLLQRSSTVVSASSNTRLDVSMAAEIPAGFGKGGWYSFGPGHNYTYSMAFNNTVPAPHGTVSNAVFIKEAHPELIGLWWALAPLKKVARGCPGVCRIKLQAPAFFATACTTKSTPLEVMQPLGTEYRVNVAAPLDHQAYLVALNLVVDGDHEVINMVTGFGTMNDCQGTLNYTACTLVSGIGLYDVEIRNGDISLEHLDPPAFVDLANNTAVNHTYDKNLKGHLSTLSDFVNIASTRWAGFAVNYLSKDGQLTVLSPTGISYEQYKVQSSGKCDSYLDPQQDILQGLNRLALYAGALTSQQGDASARGRMDPGVPTNYTMDYQDVISVFHTDYVYFLVAAIVELMCISLVAPTYWGWWRIGRAVSFSPLELAKAFESPMLSSCNSNTSGRELVQAVGWKEARYGFTTTETKEKKTKVAFGDPKDVCMPKSGMLLDV